MRIFRKKDSKYPYFIEIRPMLEKYKIKRKISEFVKHLNLRHWHKVPHITLVYNFKLKKGIEDFDLAKIIKHVTSKFDIKNLKFHYEGFELKEGDKGYILAFKIKPSSELKRLRAELYESIKPYIDERTDAKKYNRKNQDDFWFHATISYRLSEREFTKLKKVISLFKDEYIPAYPLRIPLLKESRITYEYDVLTDKILPRKMALSKKAYSEMVQAYRRKFNVEVNRPSVEDENIWLISDTHFDHKNIIKYCGRPFVDVKEMNRILLRNWNNTVRNEDKVYFLGDASFGKHSRGVFYWISKLNGRIVYIRGNHERITLGRNYHILEYKGYKFMLVHKPEDVDRFDGWIIHGHTHNNNLREYPFINGEKRTINVSVEVINYKPVSLDDIISLGLEKVRWMETILDEPEYQ